MKIDKREMFWVKQRSKGEKNMKIYDYNGKKNICGDRVHEARCKHRLTQSDLAAQLQVSGIIIERDSISRIEANAFKECGALEQIILPANITFIGDWAFNKCTSLKELIYKFMLTM